jgi:hypothetical protein
MNLQTKILNESAKQQAINIETARKLLSPTPVRLHHVPKWFAVQARQLARKIGCRLPYEWTDDSIHALARRFATCEETWMDHYGSTTIHGRMAFVAEPYPVSAETIGKIAELARQLGLECFVSANSWWYPGWTIRIGFWKPDALDVDVDDLIGKSG